MGNVACCKKPNEIIEDADLIKKSTLRKNNLIQQNPFIESNSNNKNINNKLNTLDDENKLIDLEKNNIEHQATIGPSDNMRKKKSKNLQVHTQSPKGETYNGYFNKKNYNKNQNEFDEIKNIDLINQNKDINKNINNSKNINISEEEKGPMDRVRRNKEHKINNHSNNNCIITEDIRMGEPINNNNINNKMLSDKKNLNLINHQEINMEEKLSTEKNRYFVQPTNQSIEFVNNSNYIKNSSSVNDSNENFSPKPSLVQSQFPKEISNQGEDIINKEKVIQNIQNYNQAFYQNDQLEENQIPQNTSDGRDGSRESEIQDIQSEEGEAPKDSNEVYQKPFLEIDDINNNENIDDNENEEQIKEAYIQNPDGKIYPTKQLSDSEITMLYNQCLSKGETEPDDDFSPKTYKKFYPENDPFFNFDKGEISQGQIITSPEDINHLEIYEGEINENNKKHGFGIATTSLYVRKGTWRNGEFTGWGRESRRNKDILEGKFVNGKVNGKGILKNNKGNVYVGDFVNSQREGYGELHTNRIHYVGEFKGDQLYGNGVIEFIKEGHKYEGEFKNNEINGRGIFRWKNGDIYEGEMTNGKMNGHGTYKYSNGHIYDGDYIDGLREGKGRIIYSNKVIYEGEFKGGHRIEQGNIIYSKRTNDNNANENDINKVRENYDNNE